MVLKYAIERKAEVASLRGFRVLGFILSGVWWVAIGIMGTDGAYVLLARV